MNDQVDSKGKLDIISSLQMSNTQNSSQKKEEEEEDRWSDYDEEEEEIDHGKGARVISKVENKEKTFSGLKDYLGNEVQKTGKYYSKGQQQGERGNRPNQRRKDYNNPQYAKPVYTNSGKLGLNEEESDKIINTNSDYMQKKPGTYAFYSSYNNRRGYYDNSKGYGTYDRNPRDKFASKTFTGVSQMLKSTSEENAKIRAPLRSYNESSLMQANPNENQEMMNTNSQYQPKQRPKDTAASEFQKPVFVNSNLENKSTNFKELDTEKDLFLKVFKSASAEQKVNYTHQGSKDSKNEVEITPEPNEMKDTTEKPNPSLVNITPNLEEPEYKPQNNDELRGEIESNPKPLEQEEVRTEKEPASYWSNNQYYKGGHSSYYRGGRYRKFNSGYYEQDEDAWKIVGGNKKQDYDNYNTYNASYNNYDYPQPQEEETYETYPAKTHPAEAPQSDPKPKKIIRRDDKPKVVDKVEVHLRNAKNLFELLN